ncbi:MAG: MgtC/SapB family protein [Euryarchaeota archaeon]|nr:MgtC/SapB family protein [Euryarchaeota archaeon]
MADLTNPEFFYHALLAIGTGALVGLEREHQKDETSRLAGLRTFALISLFGFLSAYLAFLNPDYGLMVIIGIPVVGAFALLLAYIKFKKDSPGMTTPAAMLVTFFSGVLVGYDLLFEAAVITVATTFLLLSRKRTHNLANVLDDDELVGALEFLTIVVILFPLTYYLNLESPLDVLNRGGIADLNYILLLVVFVSGISFISFLIIRKEGANRGIEFSGLLGGLINSAATTASMCNLVKDRRDLASKAATGIYLATGVMMARNLIIIAFAEPDMSTAIIVAPALLFAAAITLALGFIGNEKNGDSTKVEMKSPFAIGPAIKFALLIFVLSILTYAADQYVGSGVVYFSAIAGLISSAAVAASLGGLVTIGEISSRVAAETLMLATTFSVIGNLLIIRTMSPEVEKVALKKMLLIFAICAVATVLLFIT